VNELTRELNSFELTRPQHWLSQLTHWCLLTMILCSCGKLLKSENEVQLHATRSGHTNFSESVEEVKPLTEEEKQAQLAKYCVALLFNCCVL